MTAVRLNPRWEQVVGQGTVGTEYSFSMAGRQEICAVASLFGGAHVEWFEVLVPDKALLVGSYRNYNFGQRDWALAFSAKASGDAVTCKLACSGDSTARLFVYAR